MKPETTENPDFTDLFLKILMGKNESFLLRKDYPQLSKYVLSMRIKRLIDLHFISRDLNHYQGGSKNQLIVDWSGILNYIWRKILKQKDYSLALGDNGLRNSLERYLSAYAKSSKICGLHDLFEGFVIGLGLHFLPITKNQRERIGDHSLLLFGGFCAFYVMKSEISAPAQIAFSVFREVL